MLACGGEPVCEAVADEGAGVVEVGGCCCGDVCCEVGGCVVVCGCDAPGCC